MCANAVGVLPLLSFQDLPPDPSFLRFHDAPSQTGFFDFVALPLVHAMTSAFPGAGLMMRHFLAVRSLSGKGRPQVCACMHT